MSYVSDGNEVPSLGELLQDAPSNWGRWGSDDEIGALNFLTAECVRDAAALVRQGKTFTLQVAMGRPDGDPMWPGRTPIERHNILDKGHFLAGKGKIVPGGIETAEDSMTFLLHGSTQHDALGHVWFDDQMWNGYDALSTIGGLSKASILPIAERGVVGRGVLIDIARFREKESLDPGETFNHKDLLRCAEEQGVEIQPRSILLIRTGWLGRFYERGPEEFYDDFNEPGLTYSPELLEWIDKMEIPNVVTDTLGNEVTVDPVSAVVLPLHAALIRNLGVSLTEVAWLDDLASDCADDRQYEFLYVAAPLKIVEGTGAPVNPMVLK